MSSFFKRLKYYGIGFGIGTIFVIFFFQNRGCSWLPDNRVKNAILQRLIVLPDSQKEEFARLKLNKKTIKEILNNGDVDFGASEKKGKFKKYKIDFNDKVYYFTLLEESFVSTLYLTKSSKKEDYKGQGAILYMPNEKHLLFIDTNDQTTCFVDKMMWQKEGKIQSLIKKSSRIDFDSSQFIRNSKPIHRIIIQTKNNVQVSCDAIWYKEKINITRFIGSDTLKCN